jgi:hypothetical protein
VRDIDTAVVDSLKVLDPNRPIREADFVDICTSVSSDLTMLSWWSLGHEARSVGLAISVSYPFA